MSNPFRRTWHAHRVGQVLFTVHIEPHDGEFHIDRHRGLAELTRRLVDLFTANQLKATWAAGNPAKCAATTAVIRATVEHELAVLGNAGWIGPSVGRTRFAQELSRRVACAAGAGISVTSFVPHVASIKEHVDLVLKQGISAVAGLDTLRLSNIQRTAPRALHYGLWELPITQRLPLPPSWLPGGGRAVLKKIIAATEEAATFHLAIDAAAIERESGRGESTVAKIVRGVAELRNRGLVRVETLTTAAARLADVPAVAPQRSILRQVA